MRRTIAKYLTNNDYLVHCDMFNVDTFHTNAQIITCGLGESNALNIAGGIARNGKNVWVYGVSGFMIHRLEQLKFSCLNFGSKNGKIVFFNAGKYGYDKLGIGHKLDDDIAIMDMYQIKCYIPKDIKELNYILEELEKEENGVFYIQLGKDFER